MKKKLQHILSVFVVIFATIPIANAAADYTFSTPTKVWSQAVSTPTGAAPFNYNYISSAATNGYIYTLPAIPGSTGTEYMLATYYTAGKRINNGIVEQWSAGGPTDFEYTYLNQTSGPWYCYAGPAIASDDAGTLYAASVKGNNAPAGLIWSGNVGGITYWPTIPIPGQTSTKKGVKLSSLIGGRTDLMSANGDGVNGTGYLWFTPQNTSNVTRVTITKGSFSAPQNFSGLPVTNGSRARVVEYAKGKLLYNPSLQNSSGTLYRGTYTEGGTSVSWTSTGLTVYCSGSDAFELKGHEFFIYAKSSTVLALYDYTDKKEVTTFSPFSGASTQSYVSFSIDTKVNGNTADIYIYAPGQGGAKWTMTATPITSPVSNLTVANVSGSTNSIIVSWAKPSAGNPTKYAVSYSTNGGSSWSTEVETTNLNYTYANLANGTYTFKVRPYYGGSSTWGEATTSNSINVINAVGAPISNLAYTYLKNTETNVGRQDITLTWNAPTGMVNTTLTGYKVYRGGSLLATLGADALTYTNTGVKQNYTYKVVPTFDGLTEDASFGLEVTTTEVQAGVLVAPVIYETRNYEGYSLVEIFFKMPNYAPYKPLYFNLYRDGKLIQGKLQSYNTLDESLVRASVETTVKYQVEAVYGSDANVYPPIDSVKSDITTLVIAPRDWAKTGYILQEVYNVPINDIADDKKPNIFDNVDYYRQGYFRDGKWYIAQRSDYLAKKDDPDYNESDKATEIVSSNAAATGGVVTFAATTENDVKTSYSSTNKVITSEAFASVGLAMDDAGNIFMRHNNDSNEDMKTTAPAIDPITGNDVAWLTYIKDAFTRRITRGAIYKRNADGSYSTTPSVINLNKLWTDNDWINTMVCSYATSDKTAGDKNGQVTGRSDYYYMWGDVMSANGGYLILSPSWTRTAFKVKIANGAYVSHEIVEFNRYENTGYLLEPKTGTENYGFKLDGRDAVTMQIRSNGYYGVHEWNKAGTTGWHPIFTADSRINNAGGTSIQAFGEVDGTGRHTGELFVITPQSMHSHNVGDFLISRATKENADDYADEGSLMPSTPVAQYIQTDARSNSTATNANGNWFHAEKGTYASAMKDDDECVDIYQYVPGTRFARYRLIPSNQFPPVQPTLDITTAYNNNNTEITHFDGVATWKRPKGFGTSTGSANAKVQSYLFEMYNSKNELVAEAELPELYKTDGTPVDDDYVYDFDYNDTTSNVDIDFGRYSVSVRVKYQTKDGLYHISDPLFAEDIHDYPVTPAQDLAVHVFKQANSKYSVENADGTYSTVTVDNYRVELDFNAANGTEPVTHYTVRAARTAGGVVVDTIDVTDFQLHNGMKVVNGIEQANYTIASEVPGTYDFRLAEEGGSKAPFYHKVGDNYGTGGQSRQQSVLTWHHRVAPGTYGSTNARNVTIDEPSKWIYYVDANYAAKNRYIAKSASNTISTQILVETGVEVVGNDVAGLKIYPIPATTAITIKSPVAINSIVIYNEAGAEVMTAQGYDETIVEVNIENLATGYYFVKVDGNAPVKIVKK